MKEDANTVAIESQVDRCYESLRRLIVSCQLPPGSRLTEREIIDRLGFGRTPVREALLRLDQDRLIDTIPRSGYRIRPLTLKSASDFFAVWRSFAPLIVRLALPRLTASHKDDMRRLGEERDRTDPENASELSRVAGAFFDILVSAADNEPLTYIYKHIGGEMERIFQSFFRSAEGRRWLGSGIEIAAFAKVSSPEAASKLIEERVTASEISFMKMMRAEEEEAGSREITENGIKPARRTPSSRRTAKR